MAEHRLTAEPTHSRWNRALEPRLTIASGDTVHMSCLDASGGQVTPGSSVEDFLAIDRGRIHALTGPIRIDGAEPGDVLQIEVLQVEHRGWGWSSVIPGLGFLKEQFREPYLFHWALDPRGKPFAGAGRCSAASFLRSDGRCPGRRWRVPNPSPGPLRRQHGCARALYRSHALPAGAEPGRTVFRRRCARRPGRWRSLHQRHRVPGRGDPALPGAQATTARRTVDRVGRVALPGRTSDAWIVVESDADALQAARSATLRMVELLIARWSFAPIPRLPAMQRGHETAA